MLNLFIKCLAICIVLTGCRPKPLRPLPADTDTDTDVSEPDFNPWDTAAELDVSVLDPFIQPDIWVTPTELQPGGTATIHYEGTYAGASSLSLHYGFNGWNEVIGLVAPPTSSGNDWYWDRAMTPTVTGGFETTIKLPDDGRALHFVFHQEDLDVWDNNDSRDFHGSITFPYIGPFLTFNDEAEPGSGVVVNWETSVPCLGVVEFGQKANPRNYVVGTEFGNMHHVPLTGLTSGTWYYRVYDSTGRISSVYCFDVPNVNDTDLKFVAMSDMQDPGERQRFSDVATAVAAIQDDAAFVLVPGDMAAADSNGHWWTFFDKGRDLFAEHPIVPAVGNHDTPSSGRNTDTSSFARYFSLPDPGSYYSLDYGPAHLLVLCSEDVDAFSDDGGDQYLFAQADLAK
ncbi:MAG: hypothetical protein HN348_26065, partial [Proteobacteria bacterium]|nr:hypothetical protein [Pseudomonadota bacterium]